MRAMQQERQTSRAPGGDGRVGQLLSELDLAASPFEFENEALLVRSASSGPVAVLLSGAGSLAEDRSAIELLKLRDASLPIIYLARTAAAAREASIRRMGIHYFLADAHATDELRLVLETLIEASRSSSSFERFFTS